MVAQKWSAGAQLPSVQIDIKALLTRIYGLDVEKVRTLNVEGKKKRTKGGHYRRADWKKAYVTLKDPPVQQ